MLLLIDPSEDILTKVLWALVGLVVVMGGALVWVIKSRPTAPNGNGLKTKVETLEDEVIRLRDWRHTADPQIQLLMADHLARLKAQQR